MPRTKKNHEPCKLNLNPNMKNILNITIMDPKNGMSDLLPRYATESRYADCNQRSNHIPKTESQIYPSIWKNDLFIIRYDGV